MLSPRNGILVLVLTVAMAPLPALAEFHWAVERQYDLGEVRGRIDHLAYDAGDGLLFTAELANGSVSSLNLASGAVRRIGGLAEPQGIAYLPSVGSLYVATGGDGSLQVLSANLDRKASVTIGADADNVHADPAETSIAVGFADGLAFVDPLTNTLQASVPLAGHAEGFAFNPGGSRVFVNVPEAGEIAVVGTRGEGLLARWPTRTTGGNFPIALSGGSIVVGARGVSSLDLYSAEDGRLAVSEAACGDSDDVFVDEARSQIYLVCGSGEVDTFATNGNSLSLIDSLETPRGARTGLFVPELDRLFVAAPASPGGHASILVLVPMP